MISFRVSLDLYIQADIEPVQSRSRQSSRVLEDFEAERARAGALTGATASFLLALEGVRESTGTAAASASFLPFAAGAFFLAGSFLIGFIAFAVTLDFFSVAAFLAFAISNFLISFFLS
jgi:hypothetical protein